MLPRARGGGAAGASCGAAASAALAVPVTSTTGPSRVTASSACLFITVMEMRRFEASAGSSALNGTDEASPTTRSIFASDMPAAINSRRAALARSAESSQLP